MALERKSKLEMFGEFLREAAVLVFVFGLLDLPSRGRDALDFTLQLAYVVAILLVSGFGLWLGMRVEIER
ncbi:MAG: hypothetical protein ABR537_00995 [Gemmatimonadales bacterium]